MGETRIIFTDNTQPGDRTYVHPVAISGVSTETGAPGSQADVTLDGTQDTVSFRFTVPQGPQGEQGVPGPSTVPTEEAIQAAISTTGTPANTTISEMVTGAVDAYDASIPENHVKIGDQYYQATGSQELASSWLGTAGFSKDPAFAWNKKIPVPYPPPPGYHFIYTSIYTTGFSSIDTLFLSADRTETEVRIINVGHPSPVPHSVTWMLAKE